MNSEIRSLIRKGGIAAMAKAIATEGNTFGLSELVLPSGKPMTWSSASSSMVRRADPPSLIAAAGQ